MFLSKLLTELSEQGVKLGIDKNNPNQLRIRAPKGAIAPEQQKLLVKHKAEILSLLQESHTVNSTSNLASITPCPERRYEPFPLTDMQNAFWVGRSGILELGNVSNHGYYEIEGNDLDIERLNWALQKLIDRHDMLRAVVLSDGRQQVIEKVPPYQIEVLDLRGQDEESVNAQLQVLRDRMSHQVLPADRCPMFEFRATHLNGERSRLHISYDLLVFDAWSLFRLFEEWFQLYQNPDTVLPPLELTFRDYVLAQQKLEETQTYQKARNYWLNRLDSFPSAPDLPLAKNPKELTQHLCKRYEARLDSIEWQQLKQKAAEIGLTPSGVLLAAFAETITLWSKSPQFTINLALFNRLPLHPQVNDILGDFTSSTLLAIDNSNSESFAQRSLRIQEQLWQDLEHPYMSGVRVTSELARENGTVPSAMPIVFTSTLGFSTLGQETLSFRHFGELVHAITQASQVWMDIQVWEDRETLVFNWDVVEELFPEGLINDMFEAYCNFLKQLASEQKAWHSTTRQLLPVGQLSQRENINTTTAPVSEELLHTLFAKQVKAQPQKDAVISPYRTLTYQDLYALSNQIGYRLRDLGVGSNQLVAVVMEKGWEQIVAVLGILASGAAYVPIDPSLPRERFLYLLENSKARVVLSQSWLDEKLELPDNLQSLYVDREILVDEMTQPLQPVQTPEDLAYLIYTSGSTGFPKGVMIDHRGAVNTIIDINKRFGVNASDRTLALSSLSFDLSVYDIFGSLAVGGTIIIPKASLEKEPAHWKELMVQHNITIWNSVPALMQIMVDYISDNIGAFASLRLALLSGDWLPIDLPNQIQSLAKNVQVVSLGGATEASIWSILYPIDKVDPKSKSIPYGRPMVNQSFYVLNETLEPCPIWVPGHLYIGGIGLAIGYWQDEKKTVTSFITHPITGERLYRTGDNGRYLPDGNIEFIGREDFQVKIGGYRIELGEIESLLVEHPAVRQAVVTDVGETTTSKRLIAYIVPSHETSQDELRAFLRQRLPEYMIPSIFTFLVNLPLSSNGKIDRKALPKQKVILDDSQKTFVAPKNSLEKTIAQVWQDILNLEKIGVNHNFFEIGGNSLLITKIYNKLKKVLPIEVESLSLVDLFKYSTIQSLSKHLSQLNQSSQISSSLEERNSNLAEELHKGKNRKNQRLNKMRATY
ncbi:barbamide biosynthesis protein BarG [Calothrix parasitica NIES-267]|uniref:Barbamide biosynthesis protein BarG n=1 Tax=Calothrix parasitica NIES-267 TaxID=1973488 RepID=A0A1Z4LT45_9CYAN|nr:barbamide biosynthesis protein BarG [Calothrix parasitica NIES-267]